jgi:hypothetical protein
MASTSIRNREIDDALRSLAEEVGVSVTFEPPAGRHRRARFTYKLRRAEQFAVQRRSDSRRSATGETHSSEHGRSHLNLNDPSADARAVE